MRAEIEAKVAILRKSRHNAAAVKIEEMIDRLKYNAKKEN